MAASWVEAYFGIPWAPSSTMTRAGIHCWGLVRAVYHSELGIVLPEFAEVEAADLSAVAEAFARGAEHPVWRGVALGEEREFDLVLVNGLVGAALVPNHIGIVFRPGHMLHVPRGGISGPAAFRDGPTWRADRTFRSRVHSIHRHVTRLSG